MLRILDLPEPLLPISKTLRFLVFLISADRPAVLAVVDGAAVGAMLSAAAAAAGEWSISKWNSDSVETVPRDEQLLVEEARDEGCEGQVRERNRCWRRICRRRSSSRWANCARGLMPSTSVGKVPCDKAGGVSGIVAQVVLNLYGWWRHVWRRLLSCRHFVAVQIYFSLVSTKVLT